MSTRRPAASAASARPKRRHDLRVGTADDDRHDRGARKHVLHKRHLHLDGMLALMEARVEHASALLHERRREVAVDPGHAERGAVAFPVVHRHAAEGAARVIGPQNHHRVDGCRGGLPVGIRRDLTGVDVAGVGHDERHGPVHAGRQRVLHEAFERSAQRRRVGRIELPGERRRPDLRGRRFRVQARTSGQTGRDGRAEQNDTRDSHKPPHDQTPAIGQPHAPHRPSFSVDSSTKKSCRTMTRARHFGQYVWLPACPGTLPT